MRTIFSPIMRSTVESTLTMALKEAEVASEDIFRDRRRMCLDFYQNRVIREDGGEDGYLKEFFAVRDERNQVEYPEFLGLEHVKLTEKIVNKKAKVYKTQPHRLVDGKPAKAYQELLKISGWHTQSKMIDRLTWLLSDIAVGIFQDPLDEERLIFRTYTDFIPLFDPRDILSPVAVIVKTGWEGTSGEPVWAYYDDERVMLADNAGTPVEVEGVEQGEHEYGTLPFIFPHKQEPVEQFFSTPEVGLVVANQQIDIGKTGLNQLLHYNGHKQLVIVGETKDIKRFILGKARALTLSGNAAAEGPQPNAFVLDMEANFPGHIDAIKFGMELAAWESNVNIRWRIEGGPPSGISLRIQDLDDLEDREDMIDVCKRYVEQPLYEKIVQYSSAIAGIPRVEKGELMVDFQEIGYPETVDETASREKHELETDVTNPIELIRHRNPDLTEKQAAAQFLKNRRVNGLLRQGAAPTMEDLMRALEPDDDMIRRMLGPMPGNGEGMEEMGEEGEMMEE